MTKVKRNFYFFIKTVVETIIALTWFVLYLLVLPIMYLKAKLTESELFIHYENRHELELNVFNNAYAFIKYLPLSKNILTNELLIIGTTLNEPSKASKRPGIISLFNLRKRSGINYMDASKVDREYLVNAGLMYDFKILIKFFITAMFISDRVVYKPKLELFGVNFLNTTLKEVIGYLVYAIKEKKKSAIYFVNADTLNKAYKSDSFKRILNSTNYVFPDGIGVKMACNMMNNPLRQNVNGTDLLPYLCEISQKNSYKIFLYGAKEGVAKKMQERLQEKYPGIQIVGAINGFDYHDNEVVNMINHVKADIVLVAKGAPLQEEWIEQYASKICAPIVMGVGGLFDFYSGNMQRAPIWMREIGMEWLYRLIQEPKRMWKRYILGNPLFLFRAWSSKRANEQKAMDKYYEVISKEKIIKRFNFAHFSRWFYPIGKRIIDITASFLAILLLSPIFIITAFLIKYESKGPIIFIQNRVGKNGKLFPMYKFRSMVQDAEELKAKLAQANESGDGVIFKMKDDPRITRVGKFIRRWSIDELPQLFNVLFGHMSLVGPRPPVPSEVEEYYIDDLKRLHIIPGITCYWQISGRSEIPFKQQVDLDKKYISHHSLWVDIKILVGTLPAVFAKKGAY